MRRQLVARQAFYRRQMRWANGRGAMSDIYKRGTALNLKGSLRTEITIGVELEAGTAPEQLSSEAPRPEAAA